MGRRNCGESWGGLQGWLQGGLQEGGLRGSVRNISYICSFVNLANLASCSAIRLSLGGFVYWRCTD